MGGASIENLAHLSPKKIEDFILSPRVAQQQSPFRSKHKNLPRKAEAIYHESQLPYLKLDFPSFDHKKMLGEALSLQSFFVPHRKDGFGWKGLTLFGLSHSHTELLSDYGIPETDENIRRYCSFTDICQKLCPETFNFLKNNIGYNRFTRVRYMLLEPGGSISPHRDQENLGFGSLNIVLSHPDGCHFFVEEGGEIPLSPGDAFLFANGYRHCVVNNSSQPRIHILIHGHAEPAFWNPLLVRSFEKEIKKWENNQEIGPVLLPSTLPQNEFCSQPWVGLMVGPDQSIKPCSSHSKKLGYIQDLISGQPPSTDNGFLHLRSKICSLGLPNECMSCKEEERESGTSPRIFSPALPPNADLNLHIHDLKKIDLFWGRKSNIINLNDTQNSSSHWREYQSELSRLGLDMGYLSHAETEYPITQEIVDWLILKSNHCKEVILRGGEPLSYSQAIYFLEEWIRSERTGKLVVNTNGTLIDSKVLSLLERVDRLLLKLEVDAVGPNYSWLTGHSWENMEEIILKMKAAKLNFVVCPTVTSLNLHSFFQFFDFFTSHGIEIQTLKLGTGSHFLSAQHLPLAMRNSLSEKNDKILSKFNNLREKLLYEEQEDSHIKLKNLFLFVEYFEAIRGSHPFLKKSIFKTKDYLHI
jgi:pyruvate-formate lyase-activating enzyme/uncharacterized cupin superfamily protein